MSKKQINVVLVLYILGFFGLKIRYKMLFNAHNISLASFQPHLGPGVYSASKRNE
jgi:hypothetical protein